MQDSLSTIDEAENQAEKARQIQQKINDKHTRNKEKMGEPKLSPEAKKELAVSEFWSNGVNDGAEEAARQKENNDAQDKWTDNNQYVERHGAAIQQEIAEFEKDDTLVDRHPVFNKTKAELAAERAKKDGERLAQQAIDDEQSTNAKKIEERRIAEAERVQRSIDDEQLTNAKNKEAADTQRSLDDEQKIMGAQNQLISEGPSSGRGSRGKFRRLQAEKKAAAAESQSKMPSANGPTRRSSRGHRMKRGDANDPYHFTTLAYPPDAVNSQENGHFMLFYVNVQNKTKYSYNGYKNGSVVPVGDMVSVTEFTAGDETNVPPSERTGKLITEYKPGAQAAGIAGPVEYQKQMIRNGGRGNIIYNNQKVLMKGRKSPGQNLASKYPTTTRITDSVALYLPAGIGNTTNVTYGDFETGFAGYLTMSGLDVAKGLQEEDFVGVATDLFGKGGTFITDAIKKLALAGMETLGGGQGLQQNFDKIFGQTLNPYIEVAFNNTGMRTFDYTFKFAPKSKAETDEVQAIIKLFRFHMLPEMKGTSHRYLTLPSTFDIHYMWQNGQTTAKENSFYNKIATCVLTNVDVNYTPNDQVQSFGDGAPTQISMGLSFKETEMMTKQHVNEGF